MRCHVMSCHVMSCPVMSCHVMLRHVTSRHVMSCHVMSATVSLDHGRLQMYLARCDQLFRVCDMTCSMDVTVCISIYEHVA